ncbi:carbohydrate porin [Methylobacter psychrophilus]|uniref:carbohydrate porin n=1 Tax=Methylobacter psychrophilus TaxID=96941 RepID=UPI0021D50028|nr:carbohydrate porin [Methylobacter psychrophilus]
MNISKILLLCSVFFAMTAQAKEPASYPELYDADEFSIMGLLSDHDWHDLKDERWNIYSQGTYISSFKQAFPAAYTNLNGSTNSLSRSAERSFTATFTSYIGLKGWKGAEFYAAPEMFSGRPLSELKGIGGSIQNFELQKNGETHSTWYLSRVYYRQTLSFGGTTAEVKSGPMQLGGTAESRRFVFTAGTFSILDFFDKNIYAGDLRHQFLNMSFMTNAAYDFAADARGYTTGLVGEYYFDDWAFRFARIAAPKHPNDLPLNFYMFTNYGDQVELEHKHIIKEQPGAIKILGYRNRENMGSFTDAIAAYQTDPSKNATTCLGYNYDSQNSSAPDLCWARKSNVKMGIGINMEQRITEDVGLFFRGMYSDGKTEVYSYTSSDRSLSFGTLVKGMRWGREKDTAGFGYSQSWISKQHVDYLNMGGIDGFIGDGKINYRPEQLVNIYYQWHVITSSWLSFDYQYLANPAYNADRGPVNIYGVRVHFEF